MYVAAGGQTGSIDSDFQLVGERAKENKRTEGGFHDLYSLELEHMEGLVCIP